MAPILSLLVIVTVSILITRIVTTALVLTGMSHESARFQARSAFSGVGYTTRESESIVTHPVRRRIILMTMLLGNIGIATVMATVIMSFISTAQAPERRWLNVAMLVAGLLVLWRVSTSRRVEKALNKIISNALHRWTRLEIQDYVAVLQLENGYAVSEMTVEPQDWLAGKTLQDAALTNEGVLVLGIKKPDGSYLGAPRGAARIETEDVLILYAPIHRLEELDRRRAGPPGEMAHQEAVAENVEQAAPRTEA